MALDGGANVIALPYAGTAARWGVITDASEPGRFRITLPPPPGWRRWPTAVRATMLLAAGLLTLSAAAIVAGEGEEMIGAIVTWTAVASAVGWWAVYRVTRRAVFEVTAAGLTYRARSPVGLPGRW